jgi:hypothetical protein
MHVWRTEVKAVVADETPVASRVTSALVRDYGARGYIPGAGRPQRIVLYSSNQRATRA